MIRSAASDLRINRGDRLVVASWADELDGLARSHGVIVGLHDVGRPIRLANDERADDVRLIGLTIAPSHPASGRELRDIPLLSNLPARVLGIGRARHLPGPDLGSVRLRAADSLLVAADASAIAALPENANLVADDTSHDRRFRRRRAPTAIGTLAGVIALAALGVMPVVLLALVGVGIVLVTGCIDPEEAWRSIDGSVLVLIFAMLGIGSGLEAIGAVKLVVDTIAPWIGGLSPLMLADQEGVGDAWAKARTSGNSQIVDLPREIPVRLLYHNAFVGEDIKVAFRTDPYGWNDAVAMKLGFADAKTRHAKAEPIDIGP